VNTNIYKISHTHTQMKKEVEKKEDNNKQKEVRNSISCENCGSHYVYVLTSGEIICRRCSHRTSPKK